jgi:hypothetical protein
MKGVYSNSTHELMHKLLLEGIPSSMVKRVIPACAGAFSIKLDKLPSCRMASGAALEGAIAAELQMAIEMQNTKGIRNRPSTIQKD